MIERYKAVKRRDLLEVIESLRSEEYAIPGQFYIPRVIQPTYDLSSIIPYPDVERYFFQDLGDERYDFGGFTNRLVCVQTPFPADLHAAESSKLGATGESTAEKVIEADFSIVPKYQRYPRILGRPIFSGFFGVKSDTASATATITKVEVLIIEYDNNNTTIKTLCEKAIEDIDIEANGATATIEVKESVVLIFPETDAEMEDPEHNKLGVTVRAWAKTTGVGPITAAYFYYTIGSNDSYIDIPFV